MEPTLQSSLLPVAEGVFQTDGLERRRRGRFGQRLKLTDPLAKSCNQLFSWHSYNYKYSAKELKMKNDVLSSRLFNSRSKFWPPPRFLPPFHNWTFVYSPLVCKRWLDTKKTHPGNHSSVVVRQGLVIILHFLFDHSARRRYARTQASAMSLLRHDGQGVTRNASQAGRFAYHEWFLENRRCHLRENRQRRAFFPFTVSSRHGPQGPPVTTRMRRYGWADKLQLWAMSSSLSDNEWRSIRIPFILFRRFEIADQLTARSKNHLSWSGCGKSDWRQAHMVVCRTAVVPSVCDMESLGTGNWYTGGKCAHTRHKRPLGGKLKRQLNIPKLVRSASSFFLSLCFHDFHPSV